MYESDDTMFRIPVSSIVKEAQAAAINSEPTVADTYKTDSGPIVKGYKTAVTTYKSPNEISDQDLFAELNAVSKEVIECRSHILENIY